MSVRVRDRKFRRKFRFSLSSVFCTGAVALACTSILDIDGRYVSLSAAGGRTTIFVDASNPEAGGSTASGEGGAPSLGGAFVGSGGRPPDSAGGSQVVLGSGGAGGSVTGTGGAVDDCTQRGCEDGYKCCGSPTAGTKACYSPSPLVGCGVTGCDYCSAPIPINATQTCVASKCGFECNPGYVEKSGACILQMTGAGGTDAGSQGGAGGAKCVDRNCDGCGPAGLFGCCLPSGKCGCTFFNLEIGGSTSIGYCLPRPESILPPR